jgi:hypothetical protein
MANYGSGSVGAILVGGYDLLAETTDVSPVTVESVMEETTCLGDTWFEQTPVGVRRGYFTQNGFYDDAALKLNIITVGLQTTSRVVCLLHEGNAIGKRFIGFAGAYSAKYDRILERAKLHKANVQYSVSGEVEQGVILQEFEAKTADWNTEGAESHDQGAAAAAVTVASSSVANPSTITTAAAHDFLTGDTVLIAGHTGSTPDINGVHTVTVTGTTTFTIPVNVTVGGTGGTVTRYSRRGGAGYQQVGAFTGFTGFVGKIRHSADDSTYADLITFTNVTAARQAERISTSSTVNRHLAFDGNVTGSGSLDIFAGFASNA